MTKSLHSDRYSAAIAILIEARQAAGATQATVAARLRRPQSFVSKVERLERRIDIVEWVDYIVATERDPQSAFLELTNALAKVERNL